MYFAPNTDQGFIDAISEAVHATPTPIAVSISWGQSEDQWSAQSRTAMDQAFADAAALGVTVTVAAGDNGSSDDPSGQTSVHCDFPASSPNALACGGTKLIGNTVVVRDHLRGGVERAGEQRGRGRRRRVRRVPAAVVPGERRGAGVGATAAAAGAACPTWRATPTR